MGLAHLALPLVLLTSTANAQDFGPDTCVSGFVWREAYSGDNVCVTPDVRAQAADDNRLSIRRRQPGGGQFGADTCRPGFVWREARPDDHVCVTPQTREQAANDNRAASSRVLHPPVAKAPGDRIGRAATEAGIDRGAVGVGAAAVPISPQPAPPRPVAGSSSKRGFDEKGDPYIEDRLSDGSIRRQQSKGVTIIKPDGSRQFYPTMVVRSNVQRPTPPELPDDPALGRAWVAFHNRELLDLISLLVGGNQTEIQKFNAAEANAVGSDLFGQVEYRTKVLEFLAKP